jgi:hypothetical protein
VTKADQLATDADGRSTKVDQKRDNGRFLGVKTGSVRDMAAMRGKISHVRTLHGHVTRSQLLRAGITRHQIARHLDSGILIPSPYAGVYAVGYARRDQVGSAAAAVLACGPGAVLSHASALALWGFGGKRRAGPVHVTAQTDRRRPGIIVHRSGTLTRRDVTKQLGIPVTTPARTLLDNAAGSTRNPVGSRRQAGGPRHKAVRPRHNPAGLSDKQLIRAVNDALISRYLNESDLSEILQRCPRHRGAKRLAAVDPNRSRSNLEDDFQAFAARYNLPKPLVNTVVNGREVDVLFPEHRVIVEVDGWDTHRTRAAFEDDRDRDAEQLMAGLVTVRVTSDRMKAAPAREAARLHAILDRRRQTLTDL